MYVVCVCQSNRSNRTVFSVNYVPRRLVNVSMLNDIIHKELFVKEIMFVLWIYCRHC